jgi:hypothetical protein
MDHTEQLGLGDHDVLRRTPRGTLLRRDYYNRELRKPALAPTPVPHSPKVCLTPEESRRLAHKSITTTAGLYGHLVPRPLAVHVTRWTRRSVGPRHMCPECALVT